MTPESDWPADVPREVADFSPEEGLTFLELLAHELTVAVRIAGHVRPPRGAHSIECSRRAMYWINEAIHNVVQLTRDLRIGREEWNTAAIARWLQLWTRYRHSAKYIPPAIEHAIELTRHPYRPPASSEIKAIEPDGLGGEGDSSGRG